MSLFDWFRKKTKGEAPAPVETANEANGNKKVPPPPKGAEQPPESEVTRWIARWTKNVEGGDGEAWSLASGLEGLRDSPEVVEALSLLFVRRGEVQEELAITASKLWSERGERNKAMEMLEGRVSARALFALGAHAEALANLSDALAYYERVLLRDYDFLGARERVSHLREKLGIGAKQASKRETIVAARDDGPYRILREVARGGAGVVYEAEDQLLHRRVAMKVYHDAVRDRKQCEHEAKAAVRFGGPGVIRVLDLEPERAVLILEWVDGGSLRERLQFAGTRENAQRILASLAKVLRRVHAQKWVHLDLKPANILLRHDASEVVLTDFGIARPMGELAPRGSLGFESPARIAGGRASRDEDLFGLTRVAEEMARAWHLDAADLVSVAQGSME